MENTMNKILYFPIRVLLTFLIFTEVLFFISPISWNINNYAILIIYILILNIALYKGYQSGLKYCIRKNVFRLSMKRIEIIILFALLIKLVFLFIDNNFSLYNYFNKIIFSLKDAGEAYYNRNLDVNIGKYIISQLLSPIVYIGFIMGTYYWKKLSFRYKIIYICLILIEIFNNISIGVRKGLIDILLIIFITYIVSNYQLLNDKIKMRKLKVYIIISICLFLFYFLFSNLSRMSQYDSFSDMLDANYQVKDFYLEHIPRIMIMPIYSISSYLCQGYFALAKALEIGFLTPNLSATNFFTVNVAENLGLNPLEGTYMDFLEAYYGISPTINWHSIYVWFANGFTFIGVPFIIYLIGFMLANTWKKAIFSVDHIAVPLFVLLFQMIFYFFANNQFFSFSFVTTNFLILSYLIIPYPKIR